MFETIVNLYCRYFYYFDILLLQNTYYVTINVVLKIYNFL